MHLGIQWSRAVRLGETILNHKRNRIARSREPSQILDVGDGVFQRGTVAELIQIEFLSHSVAELNDANSRVLWSNLEKFGEVANEP